MHVKNEGIEVLRVLCGSRAYGLESDDSDYDYHGVYVVPTKRLLSIGSKIKESATFDTEGTYQDNTSWEIKHFLELALQCNPTVLETFIAPIAEGFELSSPYQQIGYHLRQLFPYVLNRKRIYDAFRGYAIHQRTRMFNSVALDSNTEAQYARGRKAGIAYLRSLYQGIQLLRNGTYQTRIPHGSFRHFLLRLKIGEPLMHEVIQYAQDLEHEIKVAYEASEVQTEPQLTPVNDFLLQIRKDCWE